MRSFQEIIMNIIIPIFSTRDRRKLFDHPNDAAAVIAIGLAYKQ